MSTLPPAPAPATAQRPSIALKLKPKNASAHEGPTTRSAKRKLEQQDEESNSLPSPKRTCLSIDGHVDERKRLLPRLRGGSTRRRRVVQDSDDKDDKSDKIAPAERSATPTRESAAVTDESLDHGEFTSSLQKPVNETDGSGGKDDSSEPMSNSRKADSDTDSCNDSEPASSSQKTDSETGSKKDSNEPTSSSRKPVTGTDSSSDETTESAGSSGKVAHDSNTTSDATSTASETSANEQGEDEDNNVQTARIETKLEEIQPRQISGLLNNSQQCFSNSVIQLYDAAFDGHELDTVLGEVENTEPFDEPELTNDDSFDEPKKGKARKGAKKPESTMGKLKATIHDRIQRVRKSGKLQALSPRKHLRALLHRVRQVKGKGQSELVTPFVFQQILAYGNHDAKREHLDGQEQEDCYEYFNAMLAGIKDNFATDPTDEESEKKPAIIDSLFEFKSETASLCSNESCDHKGAIERAVDNAYTIHAPKFPASLEDLLEEANVSELDMSCPKCGEQTLERVTEFTEMADNFVVHINRVGANGETKIKTEVELPLHEIELGGKKFMLNAVIRHRGKLVTEGHYTILRKRTHHWETPSSKSLWYEINDDQIFDFDSRKVKDHGRNGQSAMLLFKAV
jgi:hypothetical protein